MVQNNAGVSIITVNYNGRRLLENFLDSASKIDYLKGQLEVIVVDNGSSDDSCHFITQNYPWVKLIKANANLGFGGGNNLGIKNSTGEFVFLVNNDTVLDKNCIRESVSCYNRWSRKIKVGAVASKLILMDKYLDISLEDACFHDYKIDQNLDPINKKVYIKKHFFTHKYYENIYLPLFYGIQGGLNLSLTIKSFGQTKYRLKIGSEVLAEGIFSKTNSTEIINLKITPAHLSKSLRDLVQNAGNFLFRDGHGRDRGAEIIGGKQYYEIDKGQYHREEIVPAFCGAGVLLNKKILEKVGLFDDNFFMYYEDDDLSLRLKEAGYSVVYSPTTIIRHIHAGSSGEWSPTFVFNVERGRLLFISKHWPRLQAIWYWFWYIIKDNIFVPISHLFFGEIIEAAIKCKLRLRVNFSVLPVFLKNLARRRRLNDKQVRTYL